MHTIIIMHILYLQFSLFAHEAPALVIPQRLNACGFVRDSARNSDKTMSTIDDVSVSMALRETTSLPDPS